MSTAQKVLKIHLKKIQVSKSCRLFLSDDELDQLHAHHKGEEDARNGDDDCLREGADHVEDAAVPGLGRLSHLGGNARDLLVERVEESGQIIGDAADEQLLEPVIDGIKQKIHGLPPRRPPGTNREAKYGTYSPEQAGEQRDQGGADEGDTTASHELLDALALRAGVVISISFQEVDAAPHTEAGTQGNHQGLKGRNCGLKKSHIVFAGTEYRSKPESSGGFRSGNSFSRIAPLSSGSVSGVKVSVVVRIIKAQLRLRL